MKKNVAKTCLVSSVLSLAILSPNDVSAQIQLELPLEGIEDLQVNTPALTIINRNETDLQEPQTPRAFGLSLVNSFSEADDAIPSLGIEVSPYWWSSRPELSYEDYLKKTGFGESIPQSLSFSIATNSAELPLDGEMVDSTVIGLGFRFDLLSGTVNKNVDKNIKLLRVSGRECLDEIKEKTDLTNFEKFPNKAAIDKYLEDHLNDFDCPDNEEDIALLQELDELDNRRTGLGLSLSSAAAFGVPDNNFDNFQFSRFSTWLTASYQPTMMKMIDGEESQVPHPLNLLGIVRYTYDDVLDNSENLVDIGGRLIWRINEPLSLSAEYLRRVGDQADDRVIGVLEYKINRQYALFASFGKKFRDPFEGNEDLVTIFGVNVGFGNPVLTTDLGE